MARPLPSGLSPSAVSAFTECALAFRFANIDRLPSPPSPAALRGTIVHRALQTLLAIEAPGRTREAADVALGAALREFATHPDAAGIDLDAPFAADCRARLDAYFLLEDPRTIRPIGLELFLRAEVDGISLRGIIDRLELDADGGLVVTDYKTGRPPSVVNEQARLAGVHFYAALCEQSFGRRPVAVQLLYLAGPSPQAIVARPTARSTAGLQKKASAVWAAISRACERDDFRPRPGAGCRWCPWQAYCPAFGGEPAQAELLAGRLPFATAVLEPAS